MGIYGAKVWSDGDLYLNDNTLTYAYVLERLLNLKAEENNHDIAYEMCPATIQFKGVGLIEGTKTEYVQHELDWYNSKDRNIEGHPGIENNKIWKECATKVGDVNSNYGWCIYSNENYNQFQHAIDSLIEDKSTKRAILVYTRPSIQVEYNDGLHADRDMICTIYTDLLIRGGKLNMHVHMRSNDVWYGLRNDLAWQQNVLRKARSVLKDNGIDVDLGDIFWFADSLHLYSRNVDTAKQYVNDYCTH